MRDASALQYYEVRRRPNQQEEVEVQDAQMSRLQGSKVATICLL